MRILGIETSSSRGSIALIEGEQEIALLCHNEPNSHAERGLGLIDSALQQAGWSRTDLDRIAVGLGPGNFTGLRVGIALGQGIAAGLGIPIVGVGSLQAVAEGCDKRDRRVRCAVLDARRGELFIAAYDATGKELLAPQLIAPALFQKPFDPALAAALGADFVVLGTLPAELAAALPHVKSPYSDLPHATCVARLALRQDLAAVPQEVTPIYVRDADAVLPNLPPSPLPA